MTENSNKSENQDDVYIYVPGCAKPLSNKPDSYKQCPREEAGSLSREYILCIPSLS